MDLHFCESENTMITVNERATQRKSHAERSQETQERITLAAIEILRRQGYAGFRVADVAAEAGVSRGAQSHHFPSKVHLVLAAFSTLFGRMAESSRERIANTKPEDDVIRAMVSDASDFFLSQDFAMSLDMLASAEHDPDLRGGIGKIAKRTRSYVEEMWIDLLLSRGLSRIDSEDILWLVFSAIRGLSVRIVWQFDEQRFSRLMEITYKAAKDIYDAKRNSHITN
jgi:AcrR family transcriptional regulator